MTIAIRPAIGADLPGLLNSYAEFNPDDPGLPARAHDFYRACGFSPAAQGFRHYLPPAWRR